jgi:hypothetical protein
MKADNRKVSTETGVRPDKNSFQPRAHNETHDT